MNYIDRSLNHNRQNRKEEDFNPLPLNFLAAMRLNAMARGVKWIDSYHLSDQELLNR